MKLLIVCLGNDGDLLLTTPVLRCLKQQLNDLEIHYLLQPHHKTILEANPYIDHFHSNISGAPDIKELEKENFDHIIDLQHDSVSTKIDKALKKPVLRVKRSAFREFFFENLKWNLFPKHEHIVHRHFETVAPLGVRNDGN